MPDDYQDTLRGRSLEEEAFESIGGCAERLSGRYMRLEEKDAAMATIKFFGAPPDDYIGTR